MIKITYTKKGYIQDVYFLDTNDVDKARMIAEMRAPKGVKVRVETAE